jgi:hypothetical protein
MAESNLFTMLSTYRPGSLATPFEAYCTNGLAYLLQRGHMMLTALLSRAAGIHGEPLAIVEVQPLLADAGVADMLLTFEGGRRVVVEIQIEAGADETALPTFAGLADSWGPETAFVVIGLREDTASAPWRPVTWLQVVEALDDDPEPIARQYMEFILRDILGLGEVPLDQAVTTNRLYALGGAAIRRWYGPGARYLNSASRPMSGRYRYLGTTFSPDGTDMAYWVGLVNEQLPLTEHYHLMLASKQLPVIMPVEHPRATGDWKWSHWTGLGRVVRPITIDSYEQLLARLPIAAAPD